MEHENEPRPIRFVIRALTADNRFTSKRVRLMPDEILQIHVEDNGDAYHFEIIKEEGPLTHYAFHLDRSLGIASSDTNGKNVQLTKNETRVLAFLMQNANSAPPPIYYSPILYPEKNSVPITTIKSALRPAMSRLRDKLEFLEADEYLQTNQEGNYLLLDPGAKNFNPVATELLKNTNPRFWRNPTFLPPNASQ